MNDSARDAGDDTTNALGHELTQSISAVMANAYAAVKLLTPPNQDVAAVREILADIIESGRRAGTVLKRLRASVKREDGEIAAGATANGVDDSDAGETGDRVADVPQGQ